MKGLYLPEQQAYSVIKGTKTKILCSKGAESFFDGKVYLLAKDRIYGKISLSGFTPLAEIKDTDNLCKQLDISQKSLKKWDGKDALVATIQEVEEFNTGLTWKMSDQPPMLVDQVEVDRDVFIRVPLSKLNKTLLSYSRERELKKIDQKVTLLAQVYDDEKIVSDYQKMLEAKEAVVTDSSKKLRYVVQMKFSHLTKEELEYPHSALTARYPKVEYLLRMERPDGRMEAWALLPNEKGEFYATEKRDYCSTVWLKVGQYKEFITPYEDGTFIKTFTFDKGFYEGNWMTELAGQFDFEGTYFDGKYVISKRKGEKLFKFEKL